MTGKDSTPHRDERTGTCAFVCLGSNMGDRESFLRQAIEGMAALPGVHVRARSSIYLTEPQGMDSDMFFANQVVALDCSKGVTPDWLLENLLAIEKKLGRERVGGVRYTSRTVDLDLLLFGDVTLQSEFLTVPHPRMAERAFVLVPLLEISPDIVLPGGAGRELLARLSYSLMDDIIMQQPAHKLP